MIAISLHSLAFQFFSLPCHEVRKVNFSHWMLVVNHFVIIHPMQLVAVSVICFSLPPHLRLDDKPASLLVSLGTPVNTHKISRGWRVPYNFSSKLPEKERWRIIRTRHRTPCSSHQQSMWWPSGQIIAPMAFQVPWLVLCARYWRAFSTMTFGHLPEEIHRFPCQNTPEAIAVFVLPQWRKLPCNTSTAVIT